MMKILIYGAGVIGSIYGWQLAKAGHQITVLVRSEKLQTTRNEGITIHCNDYRDGKQHEEGIIFRPEVIDRLSSDSNFDYIIVATGSLHLKEVLLSLKTVAQNTHVLFFQNLWVSDLEEINKHLLPSQYFVGFPFMAGGGKTNKDIKGIISGSKYSKTIIGEINGTSSARVQQFADAIKQANMKPFISNQIVHWLIPHYTFIATISLGIRCAGGSMKLFLSKKELIKETILAIRDGFHVCSAMGINPKREKVNQLYYFPLFISVPVMKKVFADTAMQAMFDNYIGQSIAECDMMTTNINHKADNLRVKIPHLRNLQQSLAKIN